MFLLTCMLPLKQKTSKESIHYSFSLSTQGSWGILHDLVFIWHLHTLGNPNQCLWALSGNWLQKYFPKQTLNRNDRNASFKILQSLTNFQLFTYAYGGCTPDVTILNTTAVIHNYIISDIIFSFETHCMS